MVGKAQSLMPFNSVSQMPSPGPKAEKAHIKLLTGEWLDE